MVFAEKLQKLRKERGWTQEQLAEQINVSRQALSKWELGSAMPDTENILRISRLFGVSTDYLLYDEYESDIPRSSTPADATKHKQLRGYIVGGATAGLSALALVILGIIGSVNGGTYHDGVNDEWHIYQGLRAFLMIYHLEWFFRLLWILFAAGLVLVVCTWLSVRCKAGKTARCRFIQ